MPRSALPSLGLRLLYAGLAVTAAWSVVLTSRPAVGALPPPQYWGGYRVTPIQSFPNYETLPLALNNPGQVLCLTTGFHLPSRYVLWQADAVTELSELPPDSSRLFALNDAGVVVGSHTGPDGVTLPVTWHAGTVEALPVPEGLAGAEARAINNQSLIAGQAVDLNGERHACRWTGGMPSLLPTLPGFPFSEVRAVNESGQVVGFAYGNVGPGGSPRRRAVIWSGDSVTDLGVLPGYTSSEALAINNLGQVVGVATEPPLYRGAFFWEAGSLQRMAPLAQGGQNATPRSINDRTEIAGESDIYSGHGGWTDPQPCLWRTSTLGTLAAYELNYYLSFYQYERGSILAGNNRGQLVGTSSNHGGYLLTRTFADPTVTLASSTSEPALGDTFTVTVTVSNPGPDPTDRAHWSVSCGDGLEIVGATAATGSISFTHWGAGSDVEVPSAGQAVVTLRVRAVAPGAATLFASAYSHNDVDSRNNNTKLEVTIPGTPLPDLYGEWRNVQLKYTGEGARRRATLNAEFNLYNQGSAPAGGVLVSFCLITGTGQRSLWATHRMRDRYPAPSVRLDHTFPRGYSLEGAYLLARIDPSNRIREGIETNNDALSAPLAP